MSSLMVRVLSSVVFSVLMALAFWLKPNVTPAMFGAESTKGVLILAGVLIMVYMAYLVIQGWAVSHSDIGSASSHTVDNMVSAIPGIVAIFGFFLHMVGFWPLSFLNLFIAFLGVLATLYDMWILGGAATLINRLTDEVKMQR